MTNDESLFEITIRKLFESAQKDGIVTPEELDIIEQVKIDADSYNVILQESLSDGMIDDVEAERLSDLKKIIIERAELIASVDGALDIDEQVLLKTLSEILQKHYKNHY